jgi:hypothetical protein
MATCLLGDVAGAKAIVAELDKLFAEGLDAWFRAAAGALNSLVAGEFDATLSRLEPDVVGVATPKDAENVVEIAMLRADALAWKGDLEGARVPSPTATPRLIFTATRTGTAGWPWWRCGSRPTRRSQRPRHSAST